MVRPTSPSQTVSSVSAPTTSGRKTISVVAVEAVTAISTWPRPSRAARSRSRLLAQPAVDRLQHHDGVVHQHADREHQPHHRQHVEVAAGKYITPQVAISENGIDSETITVESRRRRKK